MRARLPWLSAVSGFCLAACVSGPTAREQIQDPARRPNVVVVLVDDLRWDELGAAGHPFVETPHIDRLAREGAMFANAFATTPLCSPSRASFLTGQYAHANGIVDNTGRSETSHRMATFPQALQRGGYETAFIGKWHMGNDDTPRPGFSRWVGMRGQGEAVDPLLNVDGDRVPTQGYVTDILVDYSVDFMSEAAGHDRPFFLFLAHKALHPNIIQRDDGSSQQIEGQPTGFVAAERHRGRYADREVPRRPNAFVAPEGKPALLRPWDDLPPLGPDTGTSDDTVRQRLEMLLAVDDGVGRMVEGLAEIGQLDNTFFVFTSDHGYFYAEHGLGGERRLAYEETARIPMIVRYPTLVTAGSRPTDLVLSIDLAPTVLDLAGAASGSPLHGRSLVPLFRGETADWRRSILIEYFSDTVFPRIRSMGYLAVRTERHKFIQYVELQEMDELYDLASDPFEMHNVIDLPESAEVVAAMRDELQRLLDETDFALRRAESPQVDAGEARRQAGPSSEPPATSRLSSP